MKLSSSFSEPQLICRLHRLAVPDPCPNDLIHDQPRQRQQPEVEASLAIGQFVRLFKGLFRVAVELALATKIRSASISEMASADPGNAWTSAMHPQYIQNSVGRPFALLDKCMQKRSHLGWKNTAVAPLAETGFSGVDLGDQCIRER